MDTAAHTRHSSVLDRLTAPSGPATDLRWFGAAMVAGGVAITVLPDVDVVLCPLRALTGVPCPFCGMTTGTLALARGDVAGSVGANPAAIVLATAILLAYLPARRRERWLVPLGRAMPGIPRWLPWMALAPMWIWQLARFDLI